MRSAVLLLLAVISAPAQIARPVVANAPAGTGTVSGTPSSSKVPRIPLGTFSSIERTFDSRFSSIGTVNDPLDLLGATRGIYLEGYGAVFTTELSLIVSPTINPFRQTISKELAEQVHQRKLARLPALKKAMQDLMRTAADTLKLIPDNQLIVVAVRLDYVNYEDTTGLPGLIVMKSERRQALAGVIQQEDAQ